MNDLIRREDALNAIKQSELGCEFESVLLVPPVEAKYSIHEVAQIIADLFGDNCACNFNGIDEWLGEVCEYRDTSCPDPGGVKCWEQYLIHKDKKDV